MEFFEKDPLDWSAGASLHGFYKPLLELKLIHPALLADDERTTTRFISTDHADKVIVFSRKNGDREVVVILNFSPYVLDLHIYDHGLATSRYTDLFKQLPCSPGSSEYLDLEPWGYHVWVN